MRFFRRSLIALGVAASLPTIIFVAVGTFILLRGESRRVEADTLGRAQMIMTLVDAQLRGDVAALDVLKGAVYFETRNWAEFYPRVLRIRDTKPHWVTIKLSDARTGQAIFDVRRPFGAASPSSLEPTILQALRERDRPLVDDIHMESEAVVFLHVPIVRNGTLEFVLSAGLRPQVFQELVEAQTREAAVVALVDTKGMFVARSLDPEHRIGQPATQYVIDAIKRGDQGLYQGRTHEGLRNYTAYYVSPWSGWSTHIAIASTLIDTPTAWSLIVAVGAGLGGALLGGILIVLVLRDMAERRRAEETLRQSQKMEAVGQLTGGIAHDFNNLLTAIIGNLDLIRTRASGNDRLQRLASNALEAAQRGAKLSAQLLAFSRNQRMQLTSVSLPQLLDGMGDLLSQSVGPAIELRTRIDAEADTVLSDPNQLELALLNLAVNARDAMPNGGVLEIESRPAVYGDVRNLPKRAYVELSIRDSGSGMTETVRARAMEPFFTTKPVGQGTGLGLSQVYGIVRESGGVVIIDSAPNEGTNVRMFLPAAPPSAVSTLDGPESSPTVPSPSSNTAINILVVDDDGQVRRFVAESLRTQGYVVTDVSSGEMGLSMLRGTHFDLMVADFAMPGMNGAELVREARKVRADLRVLMMSGYADSAALDEVVGDTQLLRKPFAVADLAAAVARALKQP